MIQIKENKVQKNEKIYLKNIINGTFFFFFKYDYIILSYYN